MKDHFLTLIAMDVHYLYLSADVVLHMVPFSRLRPLLDLPVGKFASKVILDNYQDWNDLSKFVKTITCSIFFIKMLFLTHIEN